jgi:hypothetical protein
MNAQASNIRAIFLVIAWFFYIPSLLTGTLQFEERLAFDTGFPLSINSITFIFSLVFIFLASSFPKRQMVLFGIVFALLIIRVNIEIFVSGHPESYFKYIDGFGIGLIGSVIIAGLVRHNYESSIWFLIGGLCLLLLMLTVIVKVKTGFLVRSNPYFMHGAIVFGRLMGIGLFSVLLLAKIPATLRISLLCMFSVAVVWSMSKGPILALMVALAVYTVFKSQLYNIRVIIFFSCFVLLFAHFLPTFNLPPEFNRILFMFGVEQAEGVNNAGSIGIRQSIYNATFNNFYNGLFVGPGPVSWIVNVGDPLGRFTYPHNIFLELINDFGILFGFPFIMFFLIPFVFYRSVYFPLFIFLFICQQVSGDIADGRFLIMVGALIIFTRKRFRYEESRGVVKYAS